MYKRQPLRNHLALQCYRPSQFKLGHYAHAAFHAYLGSYWEWPIGQNHCSSLLLQKQHQLGMLENLQELLATPPEFVLGFCSCITALQHWVHVVKIVGWKILSNEWQSQESLCRIPNHVCYAPLEPAVAWLNCMHAWVGTILCRDWRNGREHWWRCRNCKMSAAAATRIWFAASVRQFFKFV